MSATQALLSASLFSLLIALGIYLGFIWTRDLDNNADSGDNKAVFIMYCESLGICLIVYTLSTFIQDEDTSSETEILDQYMIDWLRKAGGRTKLHHNGELSLNGNVLSGLQENASVADHIDRDDIGEMWGYIWAAKKGDIQFISKLDSISHNHIARLPEGSPGAGPAIAARSANEASGEGDTGAVSVRDNARNAQPMHTENSETHQSDRRSSNATHIGPAELASPSKSKTRTSEDISASENNAENRSPSTRVDTLQEPVQPHARRIGDDIV